jgi:hypothetical protein
VIYERKVGVWEQVPFYGKKRKVSATKKHNTHGNKKTTANDMQNNLCSKNQYAEN